jgi:hypothetical protein
MLRIKIEYSPNITPSPQPFVTMVRLSRVPHHPMLDLKIMVNFAVSIFLIIPSSIDLDNGEYTIFLLSY